MNEMGVSIEFVYGNEYHKADKIKAVREARIRSQQQKEDHPDSAICYPEEFTQAATTCLRDSACQQPAALV
jgi:hypothetical protein